MPVAPARLLLDGQAEGTVSPFDRGLLYGDGLFETIRFVAGKAPLWARHMQRLQHGCERLGLPAVDTAQLESEALTVAEGMDEAVEAVGDVAKAIMGPRRIAAGHGPDGR